MGAFSTRIGASLMRIIPGTPLGDASSSSRKSGSSVSAIESGKAIVKQIGIRFGDTTSKEFDPPEFDLEQIVNAYNADGYVRQGIDKYVDQIFKEGYDIHGKNPAAVLYLKQRLRWMAVTTSIPTDILLTGIAEDVVKMSNCIIAKARMKDPAQLPPGIVATGLNGQEPVVGYFPINVTTMKVKRDKFGTYKGWEQTPSDGSKEVKFKPDDIVHMYYKREKGNAFGTPFLIPVLDDVRALREAEENVLRMIHRNIYPFYHVKVGDKDAPGMPHEVVEVQDNIDNMNVEGGLITSSRVEIVPIASDKVINAEPYLRYLEDRVFTGLGVPAIMFGRGDTANRSTGDNMASEMSDRIKAIQKVIEMFINSMMLLELLLEGGFDPILNEDDIVEILFKENDVDKQVKQENHAIYKYEHNAISEDEMRALLGRDPITDRSKMYNELVVIPKEIAVAKAKAVAIPAEGSGTSTSTTAGTKATNNKNKPTNQHGTKSSPKKQTNNEFTSLLLDAYDRLRNDVDGLVKKYYEDETEEAKVKTSGAIKFVFDEFSVIAMAITEEFYDNSNPVGSDYIIRMVKSIHDEVCRYISTIEDANLSETTDMVETLISTQFDMREKGLTKVIHDSTNFERKEDD